MINIDNPNPEDHLRTEWLLTNGLGGYAMGTVLGVNTRRYHGLLIAATKPPARRVVALHSLIEQLVLQTDDGTEKVINLSTQRFADQSNQVESVLHPHGYQYLKSFQLDLENNSVKWKFNVGGIEITKSLTCKQQDVVVTYGFANISGDMHFRLRPLTPMRSIHTLVRDSNAENVENAIVVNNSIFLKNDYGILCVHSDDKNGGEFISSDQIWENFDYIEDRNRYQDWSEDINSPGYWQIPLSENSNKLTFAVRVMQGDSELDSIQVDENVKTGCSFANTELLSAARQFIVKRLHGSSLSYSIIAGYPWFIDWGRDAMISLPGLLLSTTRFEEAKSVLNTLASNIKKGLIPNRFDDEGNEPHYNTVDASLWFVNAVHQYLKATDNLPTSESHTSTDLINACRSVISAYRNGTDFGIGICHDGLITAGNETTQLTWMDAKRDDKVFTPRHGKAVEINALWHNALQCLADMTTDEEEAGELREVAGHVALSFQLNFWWSEMQCLYDVVNLDGVSDGRLRPNQIFAVSLPYSPLTKDQQKCVIEIVKDRFLTPYGLRTLDYRDSEYEGRYEGSLWARDAAYHNGTVWPWLIGPYCEALLRVNNFNEESKQEVLITIQPLLDELHKTTGHRCLGQISEVFDGDEPQRPSGCVAQAWSVAELIRLLDLVESSCAVAKIC